MIGIVEDGILDGGGLAPELHALRGVGAGAFFPEQSMHWISNG
jgi:hypothetical protein